MGDDRFAGHTIFNLDLIYVCLGLEAGVPRTALGFVLFDPEPLLQAPVQGLLGRGQNNDARWAQGRRYCRPPTGRKLLRKLWSRRTPQERGPARFRRSDGI